MKVSICVNDNFIKLLNIKMTPAESIIFHDALSQYRGNPETSPYDQIIADAMCADIMAAMELVDE